MTFDRLAVTGATGRLGGRVARRLAGEGRPLRLLVRDPSRAPRLDGTTVAAADYADADAVSRALTGITTLFMVSATEAPDRVEQHRTFIDAAARAGVSRIVYTSFLGAAPDATFTLARDHWATEQHIRESGLTFTILRDNLYLDFLRVLPGPDGVIRGPAGTGRVSAVARDDIADVAAAVLRAPDPHGGRTYELTGPRALTLAEVAGELSRATGRLITYHPETIPEAYAARAAYNAPPWQLDAWVSTYTAIAAGEMARVTDDVERIAGHPATDLSLLLERARHPKIPGQVPAPAE